MPNIIAFSIFCIQYVWVYTCVFPQCPLQTYPPVKDVVDVLPKLKAMALGDRAMFEKGIKAFVSTVQAYAKHECSLIFRIKGEWHCFRHFIRYLTKIMHLIKMTCTLSRPGFCCSGPWLCSPPFAQNARAERKDLPGLQTGGHRHRHHPL